MNHARLHPWLLLRDSWGILRQVYAPILLLTLPNLILAIAAASPGVSGVLLYINGAAFIGVTPWISGATIAVLHQTYQDQTYQDRPSSWFSPLRRATRHLPHLIGSWLVLWLPLLPGLVVFAFAQAYFQLNFRLLALILLAIAGALSLPGIYLSTRLLFGLHQVMVLRLSAWSALQASWQLVQGRWWQVFGAIVVINVVIVFPLHLVAMMTSVLVRQIPLTEMAGLNGLWFQTVLRDIVGFFATPILSTYLFLLYWRLECRRSQVIQPSPPPERNQRH